MQIHTDLCYISYEAIKIWCCYKLKPLLQYRKSPFQVSREKLHTATAVCRQCSAQNFEVQRASIKKFAKEINKLCRNKWMQDVNNVEWIKLSKSKWIVRKHMKMHQSPFWHAYPDVATAQLQSLFMYHKHLNSFCYQIRRIQWLDKKLTCQLQHVKSMD